MKKFILVFASLYIFSFNLISNANTIDFEFERKFSKSRWAEKHYCTGYERKLGTTYLGYVNGEFTGQTYILKNNSITLVRKTKIVSAKKLLQSKVNNEDISIYNYQSIDTDVSNNLTFQTERTIQIKTISNLLELRLIELTVNGEQLVSGYKSIKTGEITAPFYECNTVITDIESAEKEKKQKMLKEFENNERERVKELRARKYSSLPAKLSVSSQKNGYDGHLISVSSIDDSPVLLEKIIANKRTGEKNCEHSDVVLLRTGDSRMFGIHGCGDIIVNVEVLTNRGNFNFKFNK